MEASSMTTLPKYVFNEIISKNIQRAKKTDLRQTFHSCLLPYVLGLVICLFYIWFM